MNGYGKARRARRTRSVIPALALCMFLIGMMLHPLLKVTVWRGDGETVSPSAAVKLELLQEDSWAVLSVAARVEVLAAVADQEGKALGLPFEVEVMTRQLEQGVQGTYRHGLHRITISRELVGRGTAQEVLNTLAHELYHAYQHCVVELYQESGEYRELMLFSSAKAGEYSREFEDYHNGLEGDYPEYYRQQLEVDARAFAQVLCERYGEYLGG